MSDITLIYTVFGSSDQAQLVARKLIEERLIACANHLGAATSQYMWKGKLAEDNEFPVLLKTAPELADRAEQRLKQLHDYEVPAILRWRAASADPAYAKWVRKGTDID